MGKIFKGPSLYCLKFPRGKTLSNKHFENFENLSLKECCFDKKFRKSHFKVGKIKFPKMTNSVFNSRYIVKKTTA